MLFALICSVLSEKGLSSRLKIRVLAFCVNDQINTNFYLTSFGEARMILLLSALNMISNANGAVFQNIPVFCFL